VSFPLSGIWFLDAAIFSQRISRRVPQEFLAYGPDENDSEPSGIDVNALLSRLLVQDLIQRICICVIGSDGSPFQSGLPIPPKISGDTNVRPDVLMRFRLPLRSQPTVADAKFHRTSKALARHI